MYHFEDYTRYVTETIGARVPVVRAAERGTLSFTPYISDTCSASCRFCSEKLSNGAVAGAALTVCEGYCEKLTAVLLAQRDRTMFLSVSGMEPTENVPQLALVSVAVRRAVQGGCSIPERVMYTNLSGFTKDGARLIELVRSLGLTRIECSRHHHDAAVCQSIMRFRKRETIRANETFTQVVRQLLDIVPVTMVCVMQQTGVATPADAAAYLAFARENGVRRVVFRGLSVFSGTADGAAIARYIAENRVETLDMLRALPPSFRLRSVTEGYYYYSFVYQYDDMEVLFEMSDYDRMHRVHVGTQRHKLIFYPNGELYCDWDRDPRARLLT